MNNIPNEIKNHFQVIGKINKNETIPDEDTLTITGMVSNTTKDLQDEIITSKALVVCKNN